MNSLKQRLRRSASPISRAERAVFMAGLPIWFVVSRETDWDATSFIGGPPALISLLGTLVGVSATCLLALTVHRTTAYAVHRIR